MRRYDNAARFLFLAICLIDQATKYAATHALLLYNGPFCSITPVLNTGISWSIGAHIGEIVPQVITLFVALVYVLLCTWMYRHKENLSSIYSIVCIVAGGFSNLIDRCLHHAVVDFISLHYAGYSFAIFNVADVAIVCGALWLMITIMHARDRVELEKKVYEKI